jgi:hypothetical protein
VLFAALGFNLATPWAVLALSNEKESCACCKAKACAHRKAHAASEGPQWHASPKCGASCSHEQFAPISDLTTPPPQAATYPAVSEAVAFPDLAWVTLTSEFSLYQRPPPSPGV